MHLTIVRHARALEKSSWGEDDLLRPLDPDGERHAEALARLLTEHAVRRIVSSPAVRCVQSMQPLAVMTGLEIEEWDALGPDGVGAKIVSECFANALYDDAVLCTHGEVMAPLARLADVRAVARRRDLRDDRLLTKGTAWRLRIASDGRITRLDHLVPRRR
jgi:8-oxo-dGTP diphosphatase